MNYRNKRELLEAVFNHALTDITCNTSYPINPTFFREYRSKEDIMEGERDISMYVHIPFCKNLCKFCEYTRFKSGDAQQEQIYLQHLERQIYQYVEQHDVNTLFGLDVGGGTPTSLSYENFEYLMGIVKKLYAGYEKVKDFESSIEFSFATIDDDKMELIHEAGFLRASSGIQVYDKRLLSSNQREMNEFEHMMRVKEKLKEHGISKLNIDVMYGLPNQTLDMCNNTMDVIEQLKPEQVTLYETRYNMNGITNRNASRQIFYEQYSVLYDRLKEMGYSARFGQNAFTLGTDEGVSSYLQYRMNNGIAYKGFGISAQSMSKKGISYNVLKSSKEIYMPHIDKIEAEDIYALPPQEIVAKYVSIALYSGRFSFDTIDTLIGGNAKEYYSDTLELLIEKEFIYPEGNIYYLTPKGFLYYGAVGAMFWSERHQLQYLETRE